MLKKVLIMVLVITLSLTASIFAAPGDSSDPIVVLSYLEQRISNLISDYKLDSIDDIQTKVDKLSTGGTGSSTLEIVEINKNQKLVCKAGTELILRVGEAVVVGNSLGDGISNITAGKNYSDGMSFVKDNLYIIPRDDGRGAYTNSTALFMVRGSYEIVER
jgi:hypothetical protein